MMNIMVTGASGFVGTHLCATLLKKKHHVTGVGTSKKHILQDSDRFEWISADTTLEGEWQDKVRTSDVIINLTGKNIFGYWTQKYKEQIYRSRVLTTENIVAAMPKINDTAIESGKSDPSLSDGMMSSMSGVAGSLKSGYRKPVLLNTSAIGYYGDRGEDKLTETDRSGNDFLAKVCMDWENEAFKAEEKGARVVVMRFGVVLGRDGGALKKMVPAFKFFAGGPLGKGIHWFPWIHIDDLLNAVLMLIENKNISGAVNFVSPGAIRHREFASELGHALNRPSLMPAPAFMIKTVMGELGEAFLSSQKAIPDVLNKSGFSFKFPDLRSALEDIL
ncbi:MAG: TIGR01777 family protein [Desulfamplus sp.]|nr:TIGR01777 family protein [Desulfamplus sp.]